MESTLAKLNPRELFQLKWLFGELMALLSLWTVFYLGMDGAWLITGIMAAIACAMLFPRMPGRIPPLVWKIAPFALIVIILADFLLAGSDFIPPLMRMITLLLTLRALEYRTRRHDLQLVLLALFVVIITGVLTMELSFALQILLFTPVAMLVLFLVNLSETASPAGRDAVPPDPWAGFRWSSFLGRMRRSIDRRLLLFIGALFTGTTLCAALLFVALPRFELGQALPFLRLQAQQSLSGFSETVEFGEIVEIIADDSVALRADLSGNRPTEAPYWRILALDAYTGNGFRVSESARQAASPFSDHRVGMPGRGASSENAPDWTVYLESGITRFLPVPGHFAEIRFQSRQNLIFNPWLQVLGLREVPGTVFFYQMSNLEQSGRMPAIAADQALLEADPVPFSGGEGDERLEYPETTLGIPSDSASQAILDRALSEITENRALSAESFAERAIAWLQSRHGYALTTTIPEGPADPLVRWLASDHGGHCELFAGAFLLLARQAGYPARLVTGFRGGDWNGYENYYMVRNSDAHAWVELFDGNNSWLRVDPTPALVMPGANAGEGGTGGGRGLVDRTFGAYLDSLRVLWYRRVVNFDQDQQEEMVASARRRLQELWQVTRETASAWWRDIRELFVGEWNPAEIIGFLRGLIAPLILIFLSLAAWRFRGRAGGPRKSEDRTRRRAGRCLRRFQNLSPETRASESELQAGLLALRYDRSENWPDPEPLFRQAKQLRKSER